MSDVCATGTKISMLGLRVAALFVIFVTSLIGALFPITAKRVPFLRRRVPGAAFEFAKFFGSGIVLATGFIHLLQPAAENLGALNTRSHGGCINDSWANYPYAYGLCLLALFSAFLFQMIAIRVGVARTASSAAPQAATGASSDPEAALFSPSSTVANQVQVPRHAHFDDTLTRTTASSSTSELDVKVEKQGSEWHDASEENSLLTQSIGLFCLEFGIAFHSIIIGLTLAVAEDDSFKPLFVVLIFHQMFEGLGVGTRLAFLKLSPRYFWVPWAGGLLYALCTPIGMAVGLGIQEGLAVQGAALTIVEGVMNSLSAGILLYTALVELMAHEMVLCNFYHRCSWPRFWFCIVSFAAGAGTMALIGRWA
ncbi:hypothetical protein JCM6882_006239 [Rhodosporidiobolus microsporus]